MNALTIPAQKMSSREIAELTGKEHKNVMADIRSMLEQLGLTSADFSADLADSYGRKQPAFSLPKDLTITLVSGYSVPVRHRIVTRWQQLESEASPVPALPQTLSEALRLAADLEDKRQAAVAALSLAAPKAEALDRLSGAAGTLTITEAAKAIKVGPMKLAAWLRENGWTYRRAGGKNVLGYQDKIVLGYLTHKATTVIVDKPGEEIREKVVEQVLITPKGLTKLAAVVPGAQQEVSA